MAEKRQPWMKWYTRDWRSNAKLRMCGYSARGLWADMISLMAEAEHFGFLMINGIVPTCKQLAGLLGGTEREVMKLRAELGNANVFSVTGLEMAEDLKVLIPAGTPDGVIFSRRMVRDKAKADTDRANGKGGGNPSLKAPDNRGVNPKANPQRSEGRDKSSEANASGGQPPARDVLFAECLPWLIRKTGKTRDACARMIGQWLRDEHDNADVVLAAVQLAEEVDAADPFPFVKARLPSHTVKPKESWEQKLHREKMEAIDSHDRH